MKKYRIILCLILYLLSASALLFSEEKPSSLLAEGYYKEGQYERSFNEFNTLLKHYPNNVDILFNLGNTMHKLNRTGYAIAYYKSALRLSPRDSNIRENLNLSRQSVVDKIENKRPFLLNQINALINIVSFNEALVILIIFISLINLLFIYKKYTSSRELWDNITVIFIGLLIIYLIFFIGKYKDESTSKSGVLISKKVAVKAGPSSTLSTLFFIHEGVEFTQIKDVDAWIEIRLNNGYSGWIPKQDAIHLPLFHRSSLLE